MAFSTEPDRLVEGITVAVKSRDCVLADLDERIESYHGIGYRPDQEEEQAGSSVNHQASLITLMISKLIYNNPTAMVSARRRGVSAASLERNAGQPDSLEEAANSTKAFLDAWVKYVDMASSHVRVGVDYLMFWGATQFTVRRHPGMSRKRGKETSLPMLERIPPWRLILDPTVEDPCEGRFFGHVWFADKEDLIESAEAAAKSGDDSWDIEGIKQLPEDSGLDALGREDVGGVNRKEVVCYDLWIPELQPDEELGPEDGFNGAIVSVAEGAGDDDGGTIIRKLRPYFGPPEGPYEVFGCFSVPKSVWPMSVLTMTWGQEQMLKDMVDECDRGAQEYRKVIFTPEGVAGEKGANLDKVIIPVPGFPAEHAPITVELGGVTDQQLRNAAHAETRLQKLSGMDDVQAGEVKGDGTATEHAIADQVTQTRTGYVIDQFRKSVNRNLKRAAWALWHDEDIAMPVPGDHEFTMDFEEPWILGGSGDLSPEAFDMLQIDIEAMSMERTTEQIHQRRTMQMVDMIIKIAPVARQYPEWDWQKVLGIMGDALNLPDLGSMANFEMLGQLAGMQMFGAVPNQQGGTGGVGAAPAGFGGERREVAGNQGMGQALGQMAALAQPGVA